MAQIIYFGINKGGVGKTTSCCHFGFALARLGKKVLLIDSDSQRNLTQWLLPKHKAEAIIKTTTAHVLAHDEAANGSFDWEENDTIIPIETNLDLIPSSLSLRDVEAALSTFTRREYRLKDRLEELEKTRVYDYILIDPPPAQGLLTTNALTACNSVLATVETKPMALNALTDVSNFVNNIQGSRLNKDIHFSGILMTLYDKRTKTNRGIVEEITKTYSDLVIPTPIRTNSALGDTILYNKPVFDYAPKSNGAIDYYAAVKEWLKMTK